MKRLIPIAIFSSLVAVGHSADAKPKVGILGLEPVDDSGQADKNLNLAARVMTTLIRQVAKQDTPAQYEVPESAFQEFLEVKILYDCTIPKVGCLVPIGKDLKVDVLVYGRVTLIPGQGYEVSLERLNVNGKREEGRAEEVVPFAAINAASKNANDAQKWARLLWNRVNGREVTGSITVTSNALNGNIIIDGERVGKLVDGRGRVPMVPSGDQKVRVESSDGSATGTVSVKAGEDSELELNVSKNVGPGGGSIGGSGSGGGPIDGGGGGDSRLGWKIAFVAGLIGVGAGTYVGVEWGINRTKDEMAKSVARSEVLLENGTPNADCDNTMMDETLQNICDRGNQAALFGNVGWLSATAIGVGTLYFGYKAFIESKDKSDDEIANSRRQRAEPVVRILPVGPGDIGGSLEVTF